MKNLKTIEDFQMNENRENARTFKRFNLREKLRYIRKFADR
jgi:hypothetical protein